MLLRRLKPLFTPYPCAKRLATAWILLNALRLCFGPAAKAVPLPLFCGGILLLFAGLTLAALARPAAWLENGLLVGAAAWLAWLLVWQYTGGTPYAFCAALLLALGLLICILYRQPASLALPAVGRRLCLAAVGGCAVLFIAVVGGVTCLRYATYSAPNYDFGIFANMFHHMKTTLRPLVSCERDRLLSHFAVHISPIYYLLLPAYLVFPTPYTLQIGQAVVLASGLIPLYLLCRRYALSYRVTALLAVLYAGCPALNAGCFYDIHENCFLTPALLWLFVCFEYGRTGWLYAAAAAVLLVKEDAAVYLAVFAVYIWLARRNRHGKWLLLLAVGYFLLAVGLLTLFGEGAMFGRYGNLSDTEPTVAGILRTLLCNPGHLFDQLFKTGDGSARKLLYLFQLLAPLAALPFMTRRFGRYLLLAPLLLNLLTTYPYMYDIGFQYGFGISAFLFYLAVMNLPALSAPVRRKALTIAALATCLLYTVAVLPRLESQAACYRRERESFARMDALLASIPQDASVTASGMLVAHLSNRDEIYELAYHDKTDTDYLVLDIRPAYAKDATEARAQYTDAGYVLVRREENLLEIWGSPSAAY